MFQHEEKTIVYVLVKKPEDPQSPQSPPSKPEVYFIKYGQNGAQQTGGQAQGGFGQYPSEYELFCGNIQLIHLIIFLIQ